MGYLGWFLVRFCDNFYAVLSPLSTLYRQSGVKSGVRKITQFFVIQGICSKMHHLSKPIRLRIWRDQPKGSRQVHRNNPHDILGSISKVSVFHNHLKSVRLPLYILLQKQRKIFCWMIRLDLELHLDYHLRKQIQNYFEYPHHYLKPYVAKNFEVHLCSLNLVLCIMEFLLPNFSVVIQHFLSRIFSVN